MNKKKKILWISPYAPYDSVAHGGGKTHNFYVKYFQKSNKYDITLLSLCMLEEKDKLDLDKYHIKNKIFVMDRDKISRVFRLMISGLAHRNPFDKYGGVCLPYERYQMLKQITAYRNEGHQPDIVFLQWTFSLMLVDMIKKYFPASKVIAIEEDVTFLNYLRKQDSSKGNAIDTFFWKQRYKIMKEKELSNLSKVDLVITNNPKDTRLLNRNACDKPVFTSAPYFDSYGAIERKDLTKDIIFWGAMSRSENYLSAIWLITKVLPLVQDQSVRFIVIGANPDTLLQKYASEKVIITGYVDDVREYFSSCMCMVAPLVGGAGIKIKVLEAMSAGVPVLTNDIGIEGIDAVDGREFIYCVSPEQYASCINDILEGKINVNAISDCAKKYMNDNYNLSAKLDELMELI